MTAPAAFSKLRWPPAFLKNVSPTALILTPVKQHIGCCVVVPMLLKLLGGVALVQAFIRDPHIELLVLAIALPPAVYVILRLEDAWRARHTRRHTAAHDPCDDHCAAHITDGKRAPFARRYAVNLLIAAAMALTLHLGFHHHHDNF